MVRNYCKSRDILGKFLKTYSDSESGILLHFSLSKNLDIEIWKFLGFGNIQKSINILSFFFKSRGI